MSLSILQVLASAERRGAETFGVGLGRELVKLGHQVETVAVEPGRQPELDVEVLGQSWLRPGSLRRLRGLIERVDVVVAHGSTSLPATVVAGLGCSTPIVYRQISDPVAWTATWTRRVRVRSYLSRVSHVVALTDRTRSIVVERFGVGSERVSVIPNGANSASFVPASVADRREARERFGLTTDEFVVAWIGALSAEKDPLLALEVIEKLGSGRLLMAGDGPLLGAVADAVTDRAIVLGSVSDPLAIYHAADVVLLTSRTECLPAVLIEAGLCGLPVVASDVGDVSVIVRHEHSGLLASPEEGQLVGALERLRRDHGLRRRLGAAARENAGQRFSLLVIARQWEEVLDRVVGGPS